MRLSTPNWQSGRTPTPTTAQIHDGYVAPDEVADLVVGFAVERGPRSPGHDHHALRRRRLRHRRARASSVARCSSRPARPADGARACAKLPPQIEQLTPFDYRNPDQLPKGACSSSSASATGVQLAAELRQSGQPVMTRRGERVRLPRTRGHDLRVVDEHIRPIDACRRGGRPHARAAAAVAATDQHPERTTLDLNALRRGRRPGRRAAGGPGEEERVSGGLRDVRCRSPTSSWNGCWSCSTTGLRRPSRPRALPGAAEPRMPPVAEATSSTSSGEIRSMVNRSRPHDYRWLDVPVRRHEGPPPVHDGGVVESPGLYALGLPVLRRRKSTFMHGIEDDARCGDRPSPTGTWHEQPRAERRTRTRPGRRSASTFARRRAQRRARRRNAPLRGDLGQAQRLSADLDGQDSSGPGSVSADRPPAKRRQASMSSPDAPSSSP